MTTNARNRTAGAVSNGEASFLTTAQLSALTGVKQGTLRYWRHCDEGPPSFVLGGRVLYRLSEAMAWIQQQELATRRGGRPIGSQGVGTGGSA